MDIARYELFDQTELLSRLKRIRLQGFDNVAVYRDAQLELVAGIDTGSLAPTQRFVLRDEINLMIDLYHSFRTLGVDIFALRGGVFFWPAKNEADEEDPIPLIPPIVEQSREPDGRMVNIINDGLHRLYAARTLGIHPTVVMVKNVPEQYPYYAYALSSGWQDVEMLDQLREGYQKKEYRIPDNYKSLFRDFNGVFKGVQKQRKRTNPDHLKA